MTILLFKEAWDHGLGKVVKANTADAMQKCQLRFSTMLRILVYVVA
jgi:hypothetical protein